MDMLLYYQDVLGRISHADRGTFRKELRKAMRRLSDAQRQELKTWFRQQCVCRVPQQGAEGVN
jgi:hypothetical protein